MTDLSLKKESNMVWKVSLVTSARATCRKTSRRGNEESERNN